MLEESCQNTEAGLPGGTGVREDRVSSATLLGTNKGVRLPVGWTCVGRQPEGLVKGAAEARLVGSA